MKIFFFNDSVEQMMRFSLDCLPTCEEGGLDRVVVPLSLHFSPRLIIQFLAALLRGQRARKIVYNE